MHFKNEKMMLKLTKDQYVTRKGSTEPIMAVQVKPNDQLTKPVLATVKSIQASGKYINLKVTHLPRNQTLVQLENPVHELIRNSNNQRKLQSYFS